MACRYGCGHYENESSILGRTPGAYPFQTSGTRTSFEVKTVKEAFLYARVDMPGVGEYQVDVFVKDNTVFFKGVANSEYAGDPRTYLGSFDLSSHSDKMGEIRTEMKNGVLRIFAPKVFTQILPVPQSSSDSVPETASASATNMNNPFQCKGSIWAYERFVTNEGKVFARVDMPGVVKETVKVFVSNLNSRYLIFKGRAQYIKQYEERGRSYAGHMTLDCGCCIFTDDDIKFTVENGVVQMLISKIKIK